MIKSLFRISVAGLALMTLGCATASAASKESDEGNETTIAYKDAPKAVRRTLWRESEGFVITSIDIEQHDGKMVYEADVTIDDTNYEILVNKKGLLLSKAIDNEEDENSDGKAAEKGEGKKVKDDDKPAAKSDADKGREHKDVDSEDEDKGSAKADSDQDHKADKEDGEKEGADKD
jgi:hypothetical protein